MPVSSFISQRHVRESDGDRLYLSGNTTDASGGGIYNNRSTMTFTNCTLATNSAPPGGNLVNAPHVLLGTINLLEHKTTTR